MCFIERETRNVIVKFRKIFPCKETVLTAEGPCDEKSFLSNSCDFLRNNGTCCD